MVRRIRESAETSGYRIRRKYWTEQNKDNSDENKQDPIINSLNIFYHIIFTSDDYYTIKTKITNENDNRIRFMKIIIKLPIELQMIIVNRLFDSNKTIISSKLFNDHIKTYIERNLIE
jgi:hypothetical protein